MYTDVYYTRCLPLIDLQPATLALSTPQHFSTSH